MIHEVIPVIVGELNEFLQARFGTAEDKVAMGNLVNQDGTIAIDGENKIVASLIKIEKDGSHQGFGGGFAGNPPIHINLYVMFSAYFDNANYAEALKFLSGVIGFFQANSMFESGNTPMFPSDAGRVKAEIYDIEFKELSNLWSAIGAKYLPSVIFRFRTLDMSEDNIRDEIPPISGITT